MNAVTRFWYRERIVRSLRNGVSIPEIAREHHMTEHDLRCILRAMDAIATLKRGTS